MLRRRNPENQKKGDVIAAGGQVLSSYFFKADNCYHYKVALGYPEEVENSCCWVGFWLATSHSHMQTMQLLKSTPFKVEGSKRQPVFSPMEAQNK